MKTVFILGAGASRQAGGPLMSDFLDRAETLMRLQNLGTTEVQNDFNDVFTAIAELQGVHSKSFLDLANIEVVFGAIEMARLVGKLGERNIEQIVKLGESIITLIYKTLEYNIKFPVRDQYTYPPDPYDIFLEVLSNVNREHLKNGRIGHEYSFITFNYDLALDFTLNYHRTSYDYCLSDEPAYGSTPILKLHGSINWGICEKCNKIIPYNINKANFNIWPNAKFVYYDLGSNLRNVNHCDTLLKGPPVLIPPTWNKTGYHQQLGNVWKRAALELSDAENIFVIGYSLPETDSFFRYLYALGSESATRIKRFWVFNPDTNGGVEARFRDLIGRGIENRFFYKSVTFDKAIPIIADALNQL